MDLAVAGAYPFAGAEGRGWVETYLRLRSGLEVTAEHQPVTPAASSTRSNVREITGWDELKKFARRKKVKKD